MSREILFRGKRIDNGEWVYGGYYEHITRQISPIGDRLREEDVKHLIIQSGFADWNMPRPLTAIEVIPETAGQYTGTKDKNGKDIYELDKVIMCYSFEDAYAHDYGRFEDKNGEIVGFVGIDAFGTYVECDGKKWYWLENLEEPTKEFEVIGTIHD